MINQYRFPHPFMVQISFSISHKHQPVLAFSNKSQYIFSWKIFNNFKVFLRERAEYQGLWSPHALPGWYIIPILKHYCCHQIWIPDTNLVFIELTISCLPKKLAIPTATSTDIVVWANKYVISFLKQTTKNPSFPSSDNITRKALFKLNYIFSDASSSLKLQQYPSPTITRLPRVSIPQ